MVAATLHDIVRRYQEADFGSKKDVRLSYDAFPEKVIISNDTLYQASSI